MTMSKICISCGEEIHPGRLKALPTAKTCVNCSTTGRKGGVTVQLGEGDHTYNEIIILEHDEFVKYKEMEAAFRNKGVVAPVTDTFNLDDESDVDHGLNHELMFPIDKDHAQYNDMMQFKKNIFGDKDYEFVVFFNSRNIRRKQIPDTMLAYKFFIDQLPEEKAKKCAFLLHTQIVDENGTDLEAVRELLLNDPKYNIIFSEHRLAPNQMNWLYNLTDVQIQLTSNEGWGLSLTEAILAGNPIIANVTGGMQDQMRFTKDGKWIDFDADFPSNHNGTIKEHGDWAFPVYPSNKSLVGSPLTPYIWDDRCKPEDAAEQLLTVYNLGKEERKRRGMLGREWALSDEAGLTAENMGKNIIETLDRLFATWTPRPKFEFINANTVEDRVIPHKLLY